MTFDGRITIGNVLTIAAIVIGFIASTSSNASRFGDRLERAETSIALFEARYERSDMAESRQTVVMQHLEDLRQRMERVEKKLDSLK